MRKKRKSGDGGFNVWRSYSDVMAGVLLLFILIMSLTLFQAQRSYDESIQETRGEAGTAGNSIRQIFLPSRPPLTSSREPSRQRMRSCLPWHRHLAEQEAKLKEQQELLAQQQTDLDEKTTLLSEQQTKIDNIIGVKAEVVEALQKEFQE